MRWLILALSMAFAVQAETVWNAKNKFGKLGTPQRMKVENTGELLVFTDIKRDCGLVVLETALDPTKANAFVYTYRASGTENTTGELFYARANEKFTDAHRWGLPQLQSDGKWHTVTVSAGNIRDRGDWNNGGIVESFRLDLTNGAGGRIELKEFKFVQVAEPPAKPKPQPKPKALPVMTTEKSVWNAENKFAGITWTRYVQVEQKESSLLINIDKADSQIMIEPVELDPNKCNTLIYKYRARGTGPVMGQLYFAHANDGIAADRYWRLPPMLNDGEWHEVTLNYKNLNNAFEWFKGGIVTKLRLDPTDSEGGWMELAELRFEYRKKNDRPVYKLPALPPVEPVLDEEVWPDVAPAHRPFPEKPYPGVRKYFGGKMIASREDQRGQGRFTKFYMRREIELPSKPVSAWVQFTADDSTDAYVNGKKVASSDNWRVAFCQEVTDLMTAGKNVFGFHYSNIDTRGGVFAELFVKFADGTVQRFDTDENFRSVGEAPDNWCTPEYDATNWATVVAFPGPPHAPWTTELGYIDFETPVSLEKTTIEPTVVTAGEKVRLTIDFKGILPALPFQTTVFMRLKKIVVWSEKITITAKEAKAIDENHWRIELDYETPLYFTTMENLQLTLEGSSMHGINSGYPTAQLSIKGRECVPGYETKPVFKVENIAGSPTFTLNGKPFYGLWGACWFAKRPDRQPVHNANTTPNLVSLYTIDVPWQHLDEVVPQVYDRSAELYRRSNPGAYFIVNIPFYPPREEFYEAYPDDACLDDEGKINVDGRCNYSFASKKLRQLFREYMDYLMGYLEHAPYANRIVGYRLVGGHTIEWLGWDPKPGHTLDFSPVFKAAFKEYLQKNHPEITDYTVPTLEERMELDEDEILWDPAKHAKVVAFNNFYSENVTDIVIELARHAREIVGPNKVLGTYHGYTMTLGAGGTNQLRAHFDFKRFLDANCIDFIMSPQPYSVRNMGMPMGDMKPFSTIAAHNVVSCIEDDTRTFCGPPDMGYCQTPNLEMSTSIVQRNFAAVLCRNTPTYFYSLTSGYEFDFPEAGAAMADAQRVGQHCLEQGVGRHAQIAVVVSEAAIKAMPALFGQGASSGELQQYYGDDGKVKTSRRGGTVFTTEALQFNYIRFACIGAPVDYVLAEDLADHPGDYKLYIFSNLVTYDERLLKTVEALRQRDCTLFWMYAPGYTYHNTIGVENMKRLTGFTFEKFQEPVMPAVTLADGVVMGTRTIRLMPMFHALDGEALGTYENGKVGLAKIKTGKATSVFSGVWQFNTPFLVNLARQAGVHLFSETMDPVEANDALFTLHARRAGAKRIKLPRRCDVVDVFNNKLVATDTDEFTIDAPLHSSFLFYYGKDAKSLLK